MGGCNKAGSHVDREGAFTAQMLNTHVTHAMEARAFFDRNDWGPDIANKYAGVKNVNLFNGSDGAVDLAAIHKYPGRYNTLDHGVLSDD
jgi:hypothetical protein